MKINELLLADQDRLRGSMPEEWNIIAKLELEELDPYLQAKLEDANRRSAHLARRLTIERKIQELIEPLRDQFGDLPLKKLVWLLHGAERRCCEGLIRELKELSRPVLVTHAREPWHQAVENAIPSGPLCCNSLPEMRANLERVVASVMRRDPAWPEDRMRRYAEYLIETATGFELSVWENFNKEIHHDSK